MLRKVTGFIGRCVLAADGELGMVEGFCLDTMRWVVRYIEVDTAGILEKKAVLISPAALTESDRGNCAFGVNLTRDQVARSPDIDVGRPITRPLELRIAAYYNWPRYWEQAWQGGGTRAVAVAERITGVPLACVHDFLDHPVIARDGEAGVAVDMAVDDRRWEIRQLAVAVAGKRVSISPEDIVGEPGVGKIHVRLSRKEVEESALFRL